VVTIGQTAAFFALMMVLLVERRGCGWDEFSSFLLSTEVIYGNYLDCSLGAVFTGWRRLGIFSLAMIAPGGAS
jgi:hypothetical protein